MPVVPPLNMKAASRPDRAARLYVARSALLLFPEYRASFALLRTDTCSPTLRAGRIVTKDEAGATVGMIQQWLSARDRA